MTQATATKPAEDKTCSTCPNFNNFQESNGRGWCELFDQQVRVHHPKTHDCVLNTSPEFTEAFPTEVIELDRDGFQWTNKRLKMPTLTLTSLLLLTNLFNSKTQAISIE